MEDQDNMKIVWFEDYCKECQFKDVKETEDPCNECLTISARPFSHKPEKFMPK